MLEIYFIFREGPAPFTNNSQINFETSKTGTTIQVEKQDKVTHSGLLSPPIQPPGGSPLVPSQPSVIESTSKSPVDISRPIDSVVQVRHYYFNLVFNLNKQSAGPFQSHLQ